MSALALRVDRAIRAGGLWGAADRVAVALSGGADSVALVLLLSELARQADWSLSGLIHVHHGLRGAEADRDADFCRDLAARLSLPIDFVSIDVRAAMAEARRSVEATARILRYAAFETAAGRLGASVVATGHTADDQAETVLLRLLRGASSRGVAAIRQRRGIYARPLIGCRRRELRAWLDERGVSWCEDSSNAEFDVPRNRLRHEVMPAIETAWPGGVRALARFAEVAAADEQWLTRQAELHGATAVRTVADGVELIRARVASLPVAVARRVVRDGLEAAGAHPVFREIELVRRLARSGRESACADLHGFRVECRGEVLRIARHAPARPIVSFEYRLEVPGDVRIVETGGVLRASFLPGMDRPGLETGWDAIAALQVSALRLPLTVRSRLPGDRLTPLGAPGRRSLQDLFVDRKVPRAMRETVPVVVDADGQIVWVASLAVAERCRVRTAESGMVILEFKKGTL
jgi:tRNA(Ile)-lysidine synthase